MKVAAVVPVFNEEKSIKTVIEKIYAVAQTENLNIDVIVVNDNSTDNTAEVISNSNCISLHLPINLGIGGAVQCGYKYAYLKGYEYAIRIDGDGQHPPEEIPKLINALNQKELDVVIGSRFIDMKGFQSTWFRRLGINYFKFLNKIFTGKTITDSTSGFCLINRKALEIVYEYYPDEYPEPETIVLYSRHKLKMGEVQVLMKKRQQGLSSINTFASVYYLFKVSLGVFFTFIRLIHK